MNTREKITLLICLFIGSVCQGSTYVASSGTYADVNTALGSATHGDTIEIPVDDETWATTLVVTKAVHFKGAGATGGSVTKITRTGTGNHTFDIQLPADNGRVTFSGIHFSRSAVTDSGISIYVTNEITQLVVYDCKFEFGVALQANAVCYGLIYDTDFYDHELGMRIFNKDGDDGTKEWAKGLRLGTVETMVLEDVTITYTSASNGQSLEQFLYGQNATRFTLRNFTIDSTGSTVTMPPFDMHGAYTSYGRGSHVYEIYDGTIDLNGNAFQVMSLRGGTLLMYDNVITGSGSQVVLKTRNEEYATAGTFVALDQVANSHIWNNTLNGDTQSLWDTSEPGALNAEPDTNGTVYTEDEFSSLYTASDWVTSTAYVVGALPSYTKNGGDLYRCILGHNSGASTEPGVGASWETYWVQDDWHLYMRAPESGDMIYPYTALTYPHPWRLEESETQIPNPLSLGRIRARN